jgi:5-oxoprolinase (ATP-hydrolysing)
MTNGGWRFWIDRGGTFTDFVACTPDGSMSTLKLLSHQPEMYNDACIEGIRRLMEVRDGEAIPASQINEVRMGTTVATNALLERKGTPCALFVSAGFKDALRIGFQNRPDLFALNIEPIRPLYDAVFEIQERLDAGGKVITALDIPAAREALNEALSKGIRSAAIVLMHGYKNPVHEIALAKLARALGFEQLSVSHELVPVIRFINRGDTTVLNAYLSPALHRYTEQLRLQLPGVALYFMQSNGGLASAHRFHGKDALLSGPAGGVIAALQTCKDVGHREFIAFDMGGTSTDVAHSTGTLERRMESTIAGTHLYAPMLDIHTVAAGGGSILSFKDNQYQVGPESAGALPGPACYGLGGPLTITDANLFLGKLLPEHFPKLFGKSGVEALDSLLTQTRFEQLAAQVNQSCGQSKSPAKIAEEFIDIAVEKMANAVKKISIERGHNVSNYALCSYGGAGGQHACLVADKLGIKSILIHPDAGLLSAWGMGLAARRVVREESIEQPLDESLEPLLTQVAARLSAEAKSELDLTLKEPAAQLKRSVLLHLRYLGNNTELAVSLDSIDAMQAAFTKLHEQRFGHRPPTRPLIVALVQVELSYESDIPHMQRPAPPPQRSEELAASALFTAGKMWQAPVFVREELSPGFRVKGPAILVESAGTTIVEPQWEAELLANLTLRLSRTEAPRARRSTQAFDPLLLSLFNHRFMAVAEHMGVALEKTSMSVNVKERRDYSCALFDAGGNLIANAPHIPVHLGSMGASVRALLKERGNELLAGQSWVLNDPYCGGTHLPDITVVTPAFGGANGELNFVLASRAHHADVGGISPGSMPPASTHIDEEGVLLQIQCAASENNFRERELREAFASGENPARAVDQNMADLRAQIAANHRGLEALELLTHEFGLETVKAYMGFIRENAAEIMRRTIASLKSGEFSCEMDDGTRICVSIEVDKNAGKARVDFANTSPQHGGNLNAPRQVCISAVLYAFRTVVGSPIPLNEGCLDVIDIQIPENSLLSPHYPAAVVAGNVETSQVICDAIFGAMGVLAGSQGTMNNLTFGNNEYQYYETICGGAGAGNGFCGADAVHTHMTNSLLTDPEILESRYPVLVEEFSIRPSSGGSGEFTGGNGVIRRLRFLEPMTVAIISNRRTVPPHGLNGGQPGACGKNTWIRADGTRVALNGMAEITVLAGDAIQIETPGGGGYGKP